LDATARLPAERIRNSGGGRKRATTPARTLLRDLGACANPRGWHRIADVDRPRRTAPDTVALDFGVPTYRFLANEIACFVPGNARLNERAAAPKTGF
jgi:hypothetical protein